jgi:hypothetical protein
MTNNNFDNPAKQLRFIAEQLTELANMISGENTKTNVCENLQNEKAEAKENDNQKEKRVVAENTGEDSVETVTVSTNEQRSEEKEVSVNNKGNNQNQIGGGLNGIMKGFKGNKMPIAANPFGGLMGGLGGLGAAAPQSIEEIKNNPGMMSMLNSLENNPMLLNMLSSMSGMDKDKIVSAIKALNNKEGSESSSASEAEATVASEQNNSGSGPMNNLNALEDLARLFGGQGNAFPGQNGIGQQAMQQVAGLSPLRGTIGGDPLTNLLNQWHWTPMRS